jgi:hypothetical protein
MNSLTTAALNISVRACILHKQLHAADSHTPHTHFHFLFACPLTFAEGAEEGAPVKKARAPAQPGGEELPTKSASGRPSAAADDQDEDEDVHHVPASFLSPSVLQALELGKAIPGAFILFRSTHTALTFGVTSGHRGRS